MTQKNPFHALMAIALLAGPVSAQTPQAKPAEAAAAAAPATPTTAALAPVAVSGRRAQPVDADIVTNAKTKILNRNYASSCAFMSSYNANEDAVTLAYMNSFGLGDSISNEAERFSDISPNGNARSDAVGSAIEGLAPALTDPNAAAAGCGPGDRNLAAGRNFIARKDKTLDQAFAAVDKDDYAQARSLFEAAYDKIGYEEAALMLGKIHLYGLGTAKSTPAAVAWLEKIIDARYDPVVDRLKFNPKAPEAMNPRVEAAVLLAKIHLVGMGAPKSPEQARQWYAKALDFGWVPAGNTLGLAALNGYGGKKDVGRALDYLKDAAEAGYVPAQFNLAELYASGADGVARNPALANRLFAQAAQAGHVEAMLAVGRSYDEGLGMPADAAKAISYYKDAAVKGNADAQSALATFFYEGQVVPQDLATARKLFEAAAQRGQVDAMFNLAVMSVRGEGGPKDLAMGYVWLNLAKAAGHDATDAALKAVAPLLTPQDQARADAVLKPPAKKL
ncbi:tetratricopeptide repeat protein [Roseateles oligotrophus]|uniref:Sel1 repeat family protein n=1 Tax=Roseateles oligotrophus TaxID=1769250 RepID=A0ABT2YAC1_9BURK|nr:tetratricopeptide repeat protein [Roseateles oligotrophus]MCV2367256.1 sel1 repeat family protein [Roseateles oligotrophus]